jgi:hypothetical protein
MFATSFRFCKVCLLLAVLLLASVVPSAAGSFPALPATIPVGCSDAMGSASVNATLNKGGQGNTYTVPKLTCPDGVTFTKGLVGIVDTPTLSDLELLGIWTDVPGKAQKDVFTIAPGALWMMTPGPQVKAWETLLGQLSLQGVGAMASLTDAAGLNPGCPGYGGTGSVTTDLIPNMAFSKKSDFFPCNGMPAWARQAQYTVEFNLSTGIKSTINLTKGDNYWVPAVPEIDLGSGMSALTLLSGALLVIRGSRKKEKPI